MSMPADAEEDDYYQYEEVLPDEERRFSEGEFPHDAPRTDAVRTRQDCDHIIPEVVDDFLRNFLVNMGMSRTLASFQTEWYDGVTLTRQERGALKENEVMFVPNAHTRNRLLRAELRDALGERDGFRQAAFRASEALIAVQRERDFHRLQYGRVCGEKERLLGDVQRLTALRASCAPELQQLSDKHRDALREKVMARLQRDRALRQQNLEATMRNNVPSSPPHHSDEKPQASKSEKSINKQQQHPDSEFPLGMRLNPHHLAQIKSLATVAQQATKKSIGSFCLASALNAHTLPISCLALHPNKAIVASASDDHLWRLWALPGEDPTAWEMIMTGEGHTDWLTDVSFHPNGGSLATTSGDTTVRIWDFSRGRCILTLAGHSHATWGCSFHSCGDFLASCSMDNTAKVWDLQSERCRWTLRGHADSVNAVTFLPSSNTLLTCSADKTLALWDVRAGQSTQTFHGHRHSCNHVAFSPLGGAVASCDSFGVIKLWDVRKNSAAVVTVDTGPHAGNRVAFSPSGGALAVASDDGTVKLLELASSQVWCLSGGHTDSVQSVVFDHRGDRLLSGGSDGVVISWS